MSPNDANGANNSIILPRVTPSSEGAAAAPSLPASALRIAGATVMQLVLGQLPVVVSPPSEGAAPGEPSSCYMRVEKDSVIHCAGCRNLRDLRDRLADLQVQLAGPLTMLLVADGKPPAALREELCRELRGTASGDPPPCGAGWSPDAVLQETVGALIRHWPVIMAVAQLLAVQDEVAPLDLLEVAIPVLCRNGALMPELWQLIRLREAETREAVAACARQAHAATCPRPEELRLRGELWRWESLALQVEEAEMAWGPPRSVQEAIIAAATSALRLVHGPYPGSGYECP